MKIKSLKDKGITGGQFFLYSWLIIIPAFFINILISVPLKIIVEGKISSMYGMLLIYSILFLFLVKIRLVKLNNKSLGKLIFKVFIFAAPLLAIVRADINAIENGAYALNISSLLPALLIDAANIFAVISFFYLSFARDNDSEKAKANRSEYEGLASDKSVE